MDFSPPNLMDYVKLMPDELSFASISTIVFDLSRQSGSRQNLPPPPFPSGPVLIADIILHFAGGYIQILNFFLREVASLQKYDGNNIPILQSPSSFVKWHFTMFLFQTNFDIL